MFVLTYWRTRASPRSRTRIGFCSRTDRIDRPRKTCNQNERVARCEGRSKPASEFAGSSPPNTCAASKSGQRRVDRSRSPHAISSPVTFGNRGNPVERGRPDRFGRYRSPFDEYFRKLSSRYVVVSQEKRFCRMRDRDSLLRSILRFRDRVYTHLKLTFSSFFLTNANIDATR